MILSCWNPWTWDFLQVLRRPIETTRVIVEVRPGTMALRWLEPHHDGAISGRAMLEAIVKGEHDSQQLAELSRGLLRNKMARLQQALEGRVIAHHRFLLHRLATETSVPTTLIA